MNRITLGISSHSNEGILIGAAGILIVLAINIAATVLSRISPVAVENIISKIPNTYMRLAYGSQNAGAEEAVVLPEEADQDEHLRQKILKMLTEDGLKTMLEPFPETDVEFEAIRQELRELPADDLEGKLVVSGFAACPINEQRCFECMYYLVNRKWCDVPELELPVEADWWCRLWRI